MAIQVESTPNPKSKKFVTETKLAASTQWFANAAAAAGNDMAREIFGLAGVANVMILNNFVTVGKTEDVDWPTLEPQVIETIEAHLG